MNQLPKISIVVAVFNRTNTIAKCIESVSNQTYANKELIIIDGGSTDGTIDILKKHSNDIAHWESKKDKGIYHALNKGIAKASGEWIVILGADDYLWTTDVLEKAAQELNRINYHEQVIYGKVALIDKNNHVIEILGTPWSKATQHIFFTKKNTIPHQGVFHHKSLFQKYGYFAEDYRCAGDYEFLLKILANNNRQAIFFDNLIVAGMGNDGFSNQKKHAIQILFEEIRARKNQLNYNLPKYKFICKLSKAYIKRLIANIFGEKCITHIINWYRNYS